MSRAKRHAAKGQREEMIRLSSKMKEKKKGATEEAHVAVQLLAGIILVIGVGALLSLAHAFAPVPSRRRDHVLNRPII